MNCENRRHVTYGYQHEAAHKVRQGKLGKTDVASGTNLSCRREGRKENLANLSSTE
jgi:hypothetical protein